jgi:uncharacterized protein YebE (UPF0316 family)
MEMAWYIPLLIFFARICDVPIGTVRVILVVQGHRWASAILGFFEVMIWALAVGGVIHYLTNPFALVAYGAGFSAGTLIGMMVEEKIAIGLRMVRIINPNREVNVAAALRDAGYKVTKIDGEGQKGPVEITFFTVKRRRLRETMALVEKVAPDAFVTIERTDKAANMTLTPHNGRGQWGRFLTMRK